MSKEKSINIKELLKQSEISLFQIMRLIWSKAILIPIVAIPIWIIGAIAINTSPKEFRSSASIVSEDEFDMGMKNRRIQGLANLAGFDVESGKADLGPGLYPDIAKSTPFLLDLIYEGVYIQEIKKMITLKDYLIHYDDRNLFEKLWEGIFDFKDFKKTVSSFLGRRPTNTYPVKGYNPKQKIERKERRGIPVLTGPEKRAMAKLVKRIEIEVEGRFILVKVEMPEQVLSAEMNKLVLTNLIEYVDKYKTRKQEYQYNEIKKSYTEAKARFIKAQKELSRFQDENRNIIFKSTQTEEERLMVDFRIATRIYQTLATDLEQAELTLKREKPLYTEFEPVMLPVPPVRSRATVVGYLVAGIVLGFFGVFISLIWEYVKPEKEYNTSDDE